MVVRRRGSHISYIIGSKLAVRLSDLRAGISLLSRNIILLLMVLVSVRG
jgi:hypothetical protein